jgi:ammonia channel protein AmtB
MAAITLPFDFPGLFRGQALSYYSGAAIKEGFACVVAGTAENEVIESPGTNLVSFGFVRYNTGKSYAVAGNVAQIPIATVISVFVSGIVIAVASAAIAKNARVGTAANGQVVTATNANPYVGIARTAAANAGEYFALEITNGSGA